jgi:acetamidase/formamidase
MMRTFGCESSVASSSNCTPVRINHRLAPTNASVKRMSFIGALSLSSFLPQDFSEGQIKYVDLDLGAMQGKFMPNITVPLKPFQGTLGVAPPQ